MTVAIGVEDLRPLFATYAVNERETSIIPGLLPQQREYRDEEEPDDDVEDQSLRNSLV